MRPIEACILGLFGGEKAALSFRHGEKSGFGVFGRPLHALSIFYRGKTYHQHKQRNLCAVCA
jgi:hypothetical protein